MTLSAWHAIRGRDRQPVDRSQPDDQVGAQIQVDEVMMAFPPATLLRQDSKDPTPVTVVVSRFVTPGRELEYRNWAFRILEAAEQYPNNLGAVILSPGAGQPNVYQLVHRFSDEASLRAWENSETRQRLSREADVFSTSSRQQATGMETWFSLPEAPGLPPPAKWKMAIASFLATYSLTSIVIPLEWLAVPHWPFPISNIVTNVLLAVLMTYVVMPTISSLLRDWLYSGSSGRP